MPDYFWEWYANKGYEKILSKDRCFNTNPFLIGCCIEYLTERGQKITSLDKQNNIGEILDYLKMGVGWAK